MKIYIFLMFFLTTIIQADYLYKYKKIKLDNYIGAENKASGLGMYGDLIVEGYSYSGLNGGFESNAESVYSLSSIDKTKKTYMEIDIPSNGPDGGYMIGFADSSQLEMGYAGGILAYDGNSNTFGNGAVITTGSKYSRGTTLGVLYTPLNKSITWYQNGTLIKKVDNIENYLNINLDWHLKITSAQNQYESFGVVNLGNLPFKYPIIGAVGLD